MPWRECNVMDGRVKFVARFLEGEKIAVLCRDFDISRKTGYKIIERYQDTGLEGLTDRSRRPYRHANQLPFQIEALIVRLKQEKPTWGAPKIMELLARRYPDVHRPAISTIHAVLDRHGLVKHRRGAGTRPPEQSCQSANIPMICGALITRVSSCWLTVDIAIRSLSLIKPAAICLQWRPWNQQKRSMPSRCLSGCSKKTACHRPYAPTMVCPLPHPMPCSISRSCRSGG